ncbi:13722_t:CDS:2, partial [Racocetra persica]
RNEYLHLLEQKTQQDQILQLVRADSRYLELFADNKIQIYAGQARFLLTQPKPGAVIDKVYYELIVEDRFLEALDSPTQLAEMTTQLKANIAEKITDDVNEKIEEL